MARFKLKSELLLVAFLILVGLALRLYRIDGYLTFLGDEGRDVRIVRDLLRGNLVFIGPQTSIGNMYLGPLYYYLMAPALFLAGGSPVGPAVMVALLATFTLWFTWRVGKTWFGALPALFALALYSLSPVAIIYSRSSWNPNPMPFFALLTIWSLYQATHNGRPRWLIVTGASLAANLQMHYLGLLLIPTILIFTFLKRKVIPYRHLLISLTLFLLLMSPLVLFDLKHDFVNFQAFKTFLTDRQTTVNLNPARSDRFFPVIRQMTADMALSRTPLGGALPAALILTLAFPLLFYLYRAQAPAHLLFTWLLFGILGLGIYKQHIYAHYYGFLYPAIYLFLGLSLATLWRHRRLKWAALAVFVYLIYLSLAYSPLRQAPNRQLARTEEVVDLIIKESGGQPFNFGLIAKQNYDESYRFFLENKKAPMVRGEDKVVDQLFVICEDGDACRPEGHPQWQIAVFGPAKTEKEWRVDYIRIYRLVHKKI